ARSDFRLHLEHCFVVGDVGAFDIALARNAGCRGVLVRTGWGEGSLGRYRHLGRKSSQTTLPPMCLRRQHGLSCRPVARRTFRRLHGRSN
ncbi:HAD hydrolase-like protein, partial [Rhizobium leguminosarum]|uniref:HAD hydrolase-like protein n=1 Tax=Rhizobium leguminosarum TaxID=384 RepID=UPI003F99226C